MIAGIEKHFAEVCKEQGIDLSEQKNEPEQTVPAAEEPAAEEPAAPELDPIDQLASDIDQFAFDFDPYEYRDQVEDREGCGEGPGGFSPAWRGAWCSGLAPKCAG